MFSTSIQVFHKDWHYLVMCMHTMKAVFVCFNLQSGKEREAIAEGSVCVRALVRDLILDCVGGRWVCPRQAFRRLLLENAPPPRKCAAGEVLHRHGAAQVRQSRLAEHHRQWNLNVASCGTHIPSPPLCNEFRVSLTGGLRSLSSGRR